MRYIQSFSTSGAVQEAIENQELGRPYVAYVQDGQYIAWDSSTPPVPPEPVYSAMPLTFEIISAGTITWTSESDNYQSTIEYSRDNGVTWAQITSVRTGASINVETGEILQFRCSDTGGTSPDGYTNSFGGTAKFNAYGNIISMAGQSLLGRYDGLFKGCLGLEEAENMYCPVEGVKNGKHTSYYATFQNCTNLKSAPLLPSQQLYQNCYTNMFRLCFSLNKINCLAIKGTVGNNTNYPLGSAFTNYWVGNVSSSGSSSGIFIKHPDADWPTGVHGIPEGWTVIDAQL